jgi:hypothetical protein
MTVWENEKYKNFWLGNVKGWNNLEGQVVDSKLVSKYIIEKYSVRMRWISSRNELVVDSWAHGTEPLRPIREAISWSAEWLLTFHGRPWTTKSVNEFGLKYQEYGGNY